MSLNYLMIKDISLSMIVDRSIDKFHYLQVRITTEHNARYTLMIQSAALIKFLKLFKI